MLALAIPSLHDTFMPLINSIPSQLLTFAALVGACAFGFGAYKLIRSKMGGSNGTGMDWALFGLGLLGMMPKWLLPFGLTVADWIITGATNIINTIH